MLSSDTFQGRTALVTGGSSGIGLAVAQSLAKLGANIAIIGRDETKLDSAVKSMVSYGRLVRGYRADVRDYEAVRTVTEQIGAELGPISLLVNSAAGNFRVDPLNLSPNGWRAVVDIVLNGTWNVTQLVGRVAIESQNPLSVVNIGTSAAEIGSATTVHSASAKSGVLAMTKSLAAAWAGHGIRLNVLTPGLTEDTGGVGALYGSAEELAQHCMEIPLGRFAKKEEIADACAFLLSDHAGYITGTNLVIDGGRQLGTH